MINKMFNCDICGVEYDEELFFKERGKEDTKGKLTCGNCRSTEDLKQEIGTR
jgi:hypothetical protein